MPVFIVDYEEVKYTQITVEAPDKETAKKCVEDAAANGDFLDYFKFKYDERCDVEQSEIENEKADFVVDEESDELKRNV